MPAKTTVINHSDGTKTTVKTHNDGTHTVSHEQNKDIGDTQIGSGHSHEEVVKENE